MRIRAKKYVLLGLLDRAFSVAGKGTALPILKNVKLEALDDTTLRAIGSDSELTMVAITSQVVVESVGSGVIPPKLHDVVRESKDAEIVLDISNHEALLQCAGNTSHFMLEREQYPNIDFTHESVTEVPKDVFQDCLQRCRSAILSDKLKSYFMYIQIGPENAGDPESPVVMRATDGSRLHQVPFPYPVNALLPQNAIVELIRRSKVMATPKLFIGETDRHYSFLFDEDTLYVTKHIANYPDVYRALLAPTSLYQQELLVDRKTLLGAVKRVSLAADAETNVLSLQLKDDMLLVAALDSHSNWSRESIPVNWKHNTRVISVNHRYLTDMLSALTGNSVRLVLGEDNPPRMSTLLFVEDGFTGVIVQLRQDLMDATKGVVRTKPVKGEWVEPIEIREAIPARTIEEEDLFDVVSSIG